MEEKKIQKKIEKTLNKNLLSPNLCQAKSGIFSFSVVMIGEQGYRYNNQSCLGCSEICSHFGIFEM